MKQVCPRFMFWSDFSDLGVLGPDTFCSFCSSLTGLWLPVYSSCYEILFPWLVFNMKFYVYRASLISSAGANARLLRFFVLLSVGLSLEGCELASDCSIDCNCIRLFFLRFGLPRWRVPVAFPDTGEGSSIYLGLGTASPLLVLGSELVVPVCLISLLYVKLRISLL